MGRTIGIKLISMRRIILLLFPFIQSQGQEIRFEEYFPLKNGSIQTYFVSHITETDTLTDDPERKLCRFELVKGKKVYYFTDDVKEKDDNTIIGSEVFCQGVFYFDNSNFMFSPIFWKEDLKEINLNYFEILFPKLVTLDSAYRYKDGDKKMTYRFIGFETIDIRGRRTDSCLKLSVEQDWPTTHYEDLVWFKKNIGVVKWLRSTGRLEELIAD